MPRKRALIFTVWVWEGRVVGFFWWGFFFGVCVCFVFVYLRFLCLFYLVYLGFCVFGFVCCVVGRFFCLLAFYLIKYKPNWSLRWVFETSQVVYLWSALPVFLKSVIQKLQYFSGSFFPYCCLLFLFCRFLSYWRDKGALAFQGQHTKSIGAGLSQGHHSR